MITHNILQSVYVIPILLDYWDNPNNINRDALEDLGISYPDTLKELRPLMEYHLEFVKTGKANYDLLREGLKAYFMRYLRNLPAKLPLRDGMSILDYGAGDGMLSREIKSRYPACEIITLDRPDTNADLKIDFEDNPLWYKEYNEYFHMVIMSELLHCKLPGIQNYLIQSAHEVMKKQGFLIIIENIDHVMAWRITQIKGIQHKVVTPYNIDMLTGDQFLLREQFQIQKHIIYVLQKLS